MDFDFDLEAPPEVPTDLEEKAKAVLIALRDEAATAKRLEEQFRVELDRVVAVNPALLECREARDTAQRRCTAMREDLDAMVRRLRTTVEVEGARANFSDLSKIKIDGKELLRLLPELETMDPPIVKDVVIDPEVYEAFKTLGKIPPGVAKLVEQVTVSESGRIAIYFSDKNSKKRK